MCSNFQSYLGYYLTWHLLNTFLLHLNLSILFRLLFNLNEFEKSFFTVFSFQSYLGYYLTVYSQYFTANGTYLSILFRLLFNYACMPIINAVFLYLSILFRLLFNLTINCTNIKVINIFQSYLGYYLTKLH